ncbi:MAG: complex I NDUFA9 subunit family protein [Pseudomonadota bacterium]
MIGPEHIITIFGGSGFVGRYIVRELAKTGARIRVAVRNPNSALHTTVAGTPGQVVPIFCNIRNYKSVEDALQGADMAVNCVGILFEKGQQTFPVIQAQGAEHVAHAAMRLELKKLVHLSAIGAAENSESDYARSKGQGEKNVLRYFPTATILRPSIVFGPEDDFFNRFAGMASLSPFLPLIGGGNTKFQPVYVGDVAAAGKYALEHDEAEQKIYELGGSEVLSFKELLEKMLYHIGKRRILLPIPFWAAEIKAKFLQMLPKPPLTVDQVGLLKNDNIVSDIALCLKDMDITPKTLDAILPSYLVRFRKSGTYNKGKGYEYKSQDDI